MKLTNAQKWFILITTAFIIFYIVVELFVYIGK